MKKLITFTIFLLISLSFCHSQSSSYDEALARKLGADDYGMKKYIVAFLYHGDRAGEYSKEEAAKIQQGHLANISLLAQEGKMVLAGPFFGNEELRGLFFFDVESLEEAENLTAKDPAVQAGVLKMELKEWYGSATLGMLLEFQEKVAKKGF